MQSVWVVGRAEQIATIPMPLSQGYFVYGGDAYGNSSHSPSVYHWYDGYTEENFCAAALEGGDDQEY